MFSYFFGKKSEPLYIYNYKWDKKDDRDLQFEPVNTTTELPSEFSLKDQMPPVLNQKNLGSCVSNATANALQFCLKKECEIVFAPSRLYMYYYTRLIEGHPDKDTGTSIRDMMKELHTYGDCQEDLWPYDISKFTQRPPNKCTKQALTHINKFKYQSVKQNLDTIKRALVSGFPVIIGVAVFESFQSRESMKTGDIQMPKRGEELLGYHCVLLTNFDDSTQRFGFQNSWSENVGNKGYFTIPYEYICDKELAGDFWIINFWA
jgi:C1A family cysteine protease